MNIFDMIKRVDFKTVDFTSVLVGCSEAVINAAGLSRNKELIKYRLSICDTCKLNKNGACFRDLNHAAGETETNLTTEQLALRLRDKDAITGELKFGCGCATRCKSALTYESCPLNKWLAVKTK
jgi:hypothetical protein